MKTAILTVGTEILFGQIVNTNATFLSRELNQLGFDVIYHHTVGDNKERLKEMIDQIFTKCDLIITTGGLGPTQDDLTKETIAEVMADKLVIDEKTLNDITKYFEKRNRVMTENNKKQALIPSRGIILENTNGSAPGFILENQGKVIISLPGPPAEMESMYNDSVKNYLVKYSNEAIYCRYVKTSQIGESELETRLMSLIDNQTDPTIATYVGREGVYLRITSKRKTKKEAESAVEDVLKKVKKEIGQYIYATEDISLAEVIVRELEEKGLTLSAAESCTGGLFASSIINVPGASKVFDRSIVTYSNNAKMEELDVKKETIEKYGAVSENTAIEMVEGLYKTSKSDICISVTGLAGPGGETLAKSVGLVYIAIRSNDEIRCIEETFGNSGRTSIRNRSVAAMMKLIYDTVGDRYEK